MGCCFSHGGRVCAAGLAVGSTRAGVSHRNPSHSAPSCLPDHLAGLVIGVVIYLATNGRVIFRSCRCSRSVGSDGSAADSAISGLLWATINS